MEVALATASTDSDVAIASVAMELGEIVAVSDRSAGDARATLFNLELGARRHPRAGACRWRRRASTAPSTCSSARRAKTPSSVQAVWNAVRVHVTLGRRRSTSAVRARSRLDPGARVALTLRADPASWFDGIDLGAAASDADDEGIVISDDDNRPMAETLRGNVLASFALDCATD